MLKEVNWQLFPYSYNRVAKKVYNYIRMSQRQAISVRDYFNIRVSESESKTNPNQQPFWAFNWIASNRFLSP